MILIKGNITFPVARGVNLSKNLSFVNVSICWVGEVNKDLLTLCSSSQVCVAGMTCTDKVKVLDPTPPYSRRRSSHRLSSRRFFCRYRLHNT